MISAPVEFINDCVEYLKNIVKKHLEKNTLSTTISEEDVFGFASSVYDEYLQFDIEKLVCSDPAAKKTSNPHKYVFESYKGLKAIISYRIASGLIRRIDFLLPSEETDTYNDPFDDNNNHTSNRQILKDYFISIARMLSEEASIETTIEINPFALIGKNFVIDHGVNTKIGVNTNIENCTIIGETCEIGEDCTILNGVILGASEVNKGSEQKEDKKRRHPKLGNKVTICANVKILGEVIIGNNVTICPNCIVTRDIPDDCTVEIVNQLQIEKRKSIKNKMVIWGLVPKESGYHLFGENLIETELSICCDELYDKLTDVRVINHSNDLIIFDFDYPEINGYSKDNIALCIKSDEQEYYLVNSLALSYNKYRQYHGLKEI